MDELGFVHPSLPTSVLQISPPLFPNLFKSSCQSCEASAHRNDRNKYIEIFVVGRTSILAILSFLIGVFYLFYFSLGGSCWGPSHMLGII